VTLKNNPMVFYVAAWTTHVFDTIHVKALWLTEAQAKVTWRSLARAKARREIFTFTMEREEPNATKAAAAIPGEYRKKNERGE
jgi:hypothetical protein